ncbi:MAG: polysaccharide deacetylase family protein [Nitrospira sp.]|nr:polysaccharide deacetylase family protein [Nitrospira sp.]MBP6604920.1 polysaccharide deacetylase family protein [Nitrospira sp.]HQY58619.1 polysaccharide deacetylase family protein [Nitrospira sp.]HRA95495.1 polysaccharide deacetylase family protein [Nitrospira sp.]
MNYSSRIADGHIAIFLFHGVTLPVDCAIRNYTRKHIEREYFITVVRQMKQVGTPVGMNDILHHLETGGPLPPRPFAVTFDDGFRNNLSVAAPVLVDEQVPTTFYITTDFVERNTMSWIDRVEFAVEQRTHAELQLPWGAREFRGDEERRRFLTEVRRIVKNNLLIDGEQLATEIQQQLGVGVTHSSSHPLDQKLDWSEVRALAAEPLFTVGGHGHSHAVLESLSGQELDRELDMGMQLLREKAAVQGPHYSYPEGMANCYSYRIIQALKGRGVRCCPSAIDGVNDSASDLFHLKRVMVV